MRKKRGDTAQKIKGTARLGQGTARQTEQPVTGQRKEEETGTAQRLSAKLGPDVQHKDRRNEDEAHDKHRHGATKERGRASRPGREREAENVRDVQERVRGMHGEGEVAGKEEEGGGEGIRENNERLSRTKACRDRYEDGEKDTREHRGKGTEAAKKTK